MNSNFDQRLGHPGECLPVRVALMPARLAIGALADLHSLAQNIQTVVEGLDEVNANFVAMRSEIRGLPSEVSQELTSQLQPVLDVAETANRIIPHRRRNGKAKGHLLGAHVGLAVPVPEDKFR